MTDTTTEFSPSFLSPLRLGRLTASRVPKILGLSPHGNAADVMREMVRDAWGADPEFVGNEATEWGSIHEADALDYYEQECGVEVYGAQQFTIHPEYDFLAMSPDGLVGLVGDEGMVEAKCPYRARYTTHEERPDIQAQMQLQMDCARRAWNDLVVWRPYGTTITRLDHDPTWLGFNLQSLIDFHEQYQTIVADPVLAQPYLDPLVDQRTDFDWSFAAWEYLEVMSEFKEAERRLDAAKARLVELAAGKRTRGCGVQVLVYGRKGTVNYKKLLADKGIDQDEAERYRGKPTPVTTVKPIAEAAEK